MCFSLFSNKKHWEEVYLTVALSSYCFTKMYSHLSYHELNFFWKKVTMSNQDDAHDVDIFQVVNTDIVWIQ